MPRVGILPLQPWWQRASVRGATRLSSGSCARPSQEGMSHTGETEQATYSLSLPPRIKRTVLLTRLVRPHLAPSSATRTGTRSPTVYFEDEPEKLLTGLHRGRFGHGATYRGPVYWRGRGRSLYRRPVLQGRLFHWLDDDALVCSRVRGRLIFVRGEREQDRRLWVRCACDHVRHTEQQDERRNDPHEPQTAFTIECRHSSVRLTIRCSLDWKFISGAKPKDIGLTERVRRAGTHNRFTSP